METIWQRIEQMSTADQQRVTESQKEDALVISRMESRITGLENLLSGVCGHLAMLQAENKELKVHLDSLAAAVVSSAQLLKCVERNCQPGIERPPIPNFSAWSQNNFGSLSSPIVKPSSVCTTSTDTTTFLKELDSSHSGNKPRFVFHTDVAVRTQLESWCVSQTPQLKLVFITSSTGQSPYQMFLSRVTISRLETTENLWQSEGTGKTKRDAEASACKNIILDNFNVVQHPPLPNK